MQVLKQKRLYENQRDQLYNQQFNVEQTSFMMENVQDSVQTVQAMKAAGESCLMSCHSGGVTATNVPVLRRAKDMPTCGCAVQARSCGQRSSGTSSTSATSTSCRTTWQTSWWALLCHSCSMPDDGLQSDDGG